MSIRYATGIFISVLKNEGARSFVLHKNVHLNMNATYQLRDSVTLAIFLNFHRQISRYLEVVEYRWQTYQSPGDAILLVQFYGDMRMWTSDLISSHDDVIKWKHFPRYGPFVRRIHLSPVNSPHKCQWRGALMFSLICVWINGSVNNPEAGDSRRHRAHYDVTVMVSRDLMARHTIINA